MLLLVSFVLTLGLGSGPLAADEPLETPLYDQAKKQAVESMDPPPPGESAAEGAENSITEKITRRTCNCVPVLSTEGSILLIVVLIGAGCWLILRRKSPRSGAA